MMTESQVLSAQLGNTTSNPPTTNNDIQIALTFGQEGVNQPVGNDNQLTENGNQLTGCPVMNGKTSVEDVNISVWPYMVKQQ